ncbi:hypothetical protein ACYVOU_002314 [Vibrio cholerae]
MNQKINIIIFLENQEIDPNAMSVYHPNVSNVSFVRFDTQDGGLCAIYTAELTSDEYPEDLEGSITVYHPEFEVSGLDIFIEKHH